MMDGRESAPAPLPLDYANGALKPPSERGNGFFNVCANFFLPGLGYWIIGRRRRAVIWLVTWILLYAVTLCALSLPPLVPALIVLLPLGVLFMAALIVDSYIRGHHPPRQALRRPWARYLAGVGMLCVLVLLNPTKHLAILFRDHVTEAFIASSLSMEPTLRPGDMFLVHKRVPLRRWDIVAFFAPPPARKTKWVLRIVALPGETVELKGKQVLINGAPVPLPPDVGPYRSNPDFGPHIGCEGHPIHLGPDEYYLLGDNSDKSGDARYWAQGIGPHQPGAMPRSNIIGRATWIYWPPKHWRRL